MMGHVGETPPVWLDETISAIEAGASTQQVANILGVAKSTAHERMAVAKQFMSTQRFFEAPTIPSKARDLDEIRAHRRAESKRAKIYEDAIKLIPIKIQTPGPVGFIVFGDPHIDSPGSDWGLFENHLLAAARRRSYVFAGNIGDIKDNWIGRLTRLYSNRTINNEEAWKLTEWVFRGSGVSWAWLIRGNHDMWAGDNDPLDWICNGVGVDQPHGARMAFHHPNGAITRMNARHDFKGTSVYNPIHALKRENLFGPRNHITVAGHLHYGSDARDVNGDGLVHVMCRVAGYKVSDDFAHQLGVHPKPIHQSALFIVNPDVPDGHSDRVQTASSVEAGVDYLDFLRKRFERGK